MDHLPIWVILIIDVALIVASSFFTLTETSFSAINQFKFEVKANNGSRNAKLVLWANRHFDSALVTVLIGNNAVCVILSFLTTILFVDRLLGDYLGTWASLIGSVVLTIVLYVFGETIPKQVGRKIPNKIASVVVYPLSFFMIVLYPISILFRGFSLLTGKIFHAKPEPEMTEEEFQTVLEWNEDHGLIEENESEIIQNSFDFSDTKVREIFTPREKMFTIDLKNLSVERLVEIVCSTSYSRIPVYYGNPNKIVGVLLVKNFLADYLDDKTTKTDLNDSIEKPFIVSPNVTMDELVEGFQEQRKQIALVYKKNVLVGMVTMEDVLEELVGTIGEKSVVNLDEKKTSPKSKKEKKPRRGER